MVDKVPWKAAQPSYWTLKEVPIEDVPPKPYDVFIAGSGPIGAAFAKILLENPNDSFRVYMADIGAQNSPTIGSHHKNAI
ncbi:hypothetical protein FRC12_022741, partial [Ceratobasidium sp. 428]